VAAAALFLVAEPTLGVHGAVTATVFVAAVVAWLVGRVDDTYVALAAALVLVLVGVLPPDELFASLGDDTIWLLIAAFVLAAGIASSGLAARGAVFLAGGAASVRQLAHLVTAALVVTTFAVPATSGRAALAVPVFTALASAIDRRRVVHALALLFPTVILLSAARR
jgi:solute carrier family 13 (sodium-dependent dicarboxylate transporter), member 2/3/5